MNGFLGLALIAVAASCLVSRKSSDFACSTTTDCQDGRVCNDGFCEPSCPAECSSCDLGELQCNVDCTDAGGCGDITCPTGFDCQVDCSASNACGNVSCGGATSCDVSCHGSMACGAVTCGPGDCKIDCSGSSACASVDCSTSCGCDVDCNGGDCGGAAVCPSPGGIDCTDGDDGCSDSTDSACNQC